MKKLILHEAVLENLELGLLMKESRESHLLTTSIKTSVDDSIALATSAPANVGYRSMTLNQQVTPGSCGHLYSMHHTLNMGDQSIGVFQHNLTGLCSLVGTFEKRTHNLSQNGTAQLIKVSSTSAPNDDIVVLISILTSDLDGVRKLIKEEG